jgi:hypothetical protein
MFEGLFKSEVALARHRDAPLAEERARYIQHCIERGSPADNDVHAAPAFSTFAQV